MLDKFELTAKISGEMEAFEDSATEYDSMGFTFDFENKPKSNVTGTFNGAVLLRKLLKFMERNGFDVQQVLAETIVLLGESGYGDNGDEADIYMGDLYDAAISVARSSESST